MLAVCAAPELSPHHGRLYALPPRRRDAQARQPAPRRAPARRRRRRGGGRAGTVRPRADPASRGALRVLDGDGAAARRPRGKGRPTAWPRCCSAPICDAAEAGRCAEVDAPAYGPGRARPSTSSAACSRSTRLPLVVAGPDAAALWRRASRCSARRRRRRPATLRSCARPISSPRSSGAALAFDGLERLEPADRPALALRSRRERPPVCAASRDAAARLGDRTALVVEVPARRSSSAARRGPRSPVSTDVEDVAAKFRLSMAQIATPRRSRGSPPGPRRTARAGGPRPRRARRRPRRASASSPTRLEPGFGWDDLVLPERQLEVLRSISAYLRHRDRAHRVGLRAHASPGPRG